jgi:4-amino-4-deoxy-L-arabinose transferase-like glycosyltransferase
MRLKYSKTKIALLFILIVLLILQVAVNFQVLSRVSVVRFCDESEYLKRGLEVYDIIFNDQNGMYRLNKLGDLIRLQDRAMDRPPFLFVLQAFTWRFLKVFNIWNENMIILIINTLFLFIMVLSCYGIGLFLYNKKVGFVSAVLVAFSPIVFKAPRRMMTDLPLAAMLCLSLYLLLKTDRFRSRFFSICLGIILAAAQLTRETLVFYIVSPFFYYVYISFKQAPRKEVLHNILLCIGFSAIVAGPVFLNPASFYAYRKYLLFSQIPQTYSNHFYYLVNTPAILGYILLVPLLPLFVSAAINIRRVDKILLLWFLIPFIVLSFSPNQFLRFIMPIIPALFLIIINELFKSGLNPVLKKFYAVIIMFACFFQYIAANYLPETRSILPDRDRFEVRNIYVYNKYFTTHQRLMEVFRNERITGKSNKKVLALFGVPEIFYPLQYRFKMDGIPLTTDFSIQEDSADAPQPGAMDWEILLLNSDYLIDKIGGFMGETGSREDIRTQFKNALLKHKDNFKVIAEIEIPYDNSYVIVYKKKHNQ